MKIPDAVRLGDMPRIETDEPLGLDGVFDLLGQVASRRKREAGELEEREKQRGPVQPVAQPATATGIIFRTLEELLAVPDTEPEWRITDWFPAGGRVLIAAQRKVGKTTLTGNLVRSLADGVPFLGDAEVRPLAEGEKVVLLDFEMSPRKLTKWLRLQGIQRTDRVTVQTMVGQRAKFNICKKQIRAAWVQDLKVLRCAVLIIDCLRPILDALGMAEHSEAGRFLDALDSLMLEAGISEIVLIHHIGHQEGRPRGDSRIRDWPDAEILFFRSKKTQRRYIEAFGRDVDQKRCALKYDEESRAPDDRAREARRRSGAGP